MSERKVTLVENFSFVATDGRVLFFNFCNVTAVCQNGQNDSVPSILEGNSGRS